jgi:hypothetical protein
LERRKVGVAVLTVALLFAGLLAGAEYVVRFGVRDSLRVLEVGPQIVVRQALIRRLRVAVPLLYAPAMLSAMVVAVWRPTVVEVAGVVALLVWTAVTFTGTVPINAGILDWQPAAPPPVWTVIIERWERLDTARVLAAMVAFGCFLAQNMR